MLFRFKYLLFVILLTGVAADAIALNGCARFLLWRPSATATALGGSGVATYNSAFSLYYNPALLTETGGVDIAGSYVKPLPFFENIVQSYGGIVYRLDEKSVLGCSANLIWRGGQMHTSEGGNYLGNDGDDYLFSGHFKIAYAQEIMGGVACGLAAGLMHHEVASDDFIVWADVVPSSVRKLLFDLGFFKSDLFTEASLILSPQELPPLLRSTGPAYDPPGLSIGLSLLNLGTTITFGNEEYADPPPSLLLIGAAWCPVTSNWLQLRLVTDLEKQLVESSLLDYIRTGTELRWMQTLIFRGGYVLDTYGPRNSYPVWGAGLLFKFGSINVSRYNASLVPCWHFDMRLSWRLS